MHLAEVLQHAICKIPLSEADGENGKIDCILIAFFSPDNHSRHFYTQACNHLQYECVCTHTYIHTMVAKPPAHYKQEHIHKQCWLLHGRFDM